MTLEQKINAKRKLIYKHKKELEELLSTCDHQGYVVTKSSYFSGSYYDKAYTNYWNECSLCGATSDKVTDQHNYYG